MKVLAYIDQQIGAEIFPQFPNFPAHSPCANALSAMRPDPANFRNDLAA